MAEPRPLTLAALAPVVISLFLGGIIGIEIHKYSTVGPEKSSTGGASRSSAGGGAPGSGGGGGMGGGMGGGGNTPNSGRTLSRLVSSLSTIEKIQGKGLTAEQKQKINPILLAIKSADSLPEAEAKTKLESLQAILIPAQTDAIAEMTPQRGGRGGGGAPGSGGPGGGGAPGGGGPGSGGRPMSGGMGGPPQTAMAGGPLGGGGGGGGQQDPNKPFASDRNKKALDDLMADVSGNQKK